jgi:predicted nucleic acid-binding Zn ribbon protein
MKDKKDSLSSLKDVMDSIFCDPGSPISVEKRQIYKAWQEVMGPSISKYCHPEWFIRGELGIGVSDPIWLQEMEFRKDEIKRRLNQRLGTDHIKRLEFHLSS